MSRIAVPSSRASIILVALVLFVSGALTAGRPANDDCGDAALVQGLPYAASEPAIEDATLSLAPPDPIPGCANPGREHSVWYEYTAPTDAWVRVTTAGSDFNSVAWVGTGSCDAPVELACDDNSAGASNADLSFQTQAGQTYRIMAASWFPIADGTLQLLIEEDLSPPQIASDQTWTLADSPVVFTSDTTILPGVTVTVEPGVVVELQQGARLIVEGNLVGTGTPSSPISFVGGSVSFVYMEVPGSLVLSHAFFDFQLRPKMQGSLEITDTTFGPNAMLSNVGSGYYISLERCTFNGSYVWLGGGTIRLADTHVADNFLSLGGSYVHLNNVSVTDAPQWSLRFAGFEQPVFIDNVTASNSAGGGLELVAGNFFIGENVQLLGNAHTVELAGAGILPGSTLPASGNLNNYIKVESQSFGSWSNVWADAGVPYAMTGGQYHSGSLEILPGVTVLLEPNFTWWDDEDAVDARGLPDAPVRFERLVPGQSWQGLQYFHRFENCVIDGGQVGARFSSWTTGGYIDNCIIRNNDFGSQNASKIRKTRFINNTVGVWDNGVDGALESTTNPNSFVGNDLAVDYTDSIIDARHAWWGDPTGPATPANPGGNGDPVDVGVEAVPFLTAEPDFNDNPPIVRLLGGPRPENAGGAYSSFADPGTTAIISWTSDDDVGVVAHRVEFYNSWEFTWTVVAELPGTQRSFEWVVPNMGPTANSSVPKLRVTAIDTAGQEGWDEHRYLIPTGDEPGTLTVTLDLAGSPFTVNDAIGPLCFQADGVDPYAQVVAELSFDGDQRHIPLGSAFVGGCLGGPSSNGPTVPFVSTDTARIRLNTSGGQNRVNYFFSDYFTIRPDARVGDAAPTVTMTSPVGGESYAGGGSLPITWTAGDDEGLRAVDIQVSTDGGRTWHFIAESLPPTATAFDWQLPPSAGIADVRVRVMVSDLRFQTSSSGGDVTFAITPGSGGTTCTHAPDEVHGVLVDANKSTLMWTSGSPDDLYDVARGSVDGLVSGQPAVCLETGLTLPQHVDITVPAPGETLYYLVRAANECGSGAWGSGSAGQARSACP